MKKILFNGCSFTAGEGLQEYEMDFSQIINEDPDFETINLAVPGTGNKWIHRELATPLGFQKWTNRPRGIVGGLGQNLKTFGLFGLSSRTPFLGLWLCGDSIYPGEGTAGVSQSALMVVRQIIASRGLSEFYL